MKGGYVLTFSDKTMGRFFDDEFGIAIYQERYAFNGTSKAKYVRAFIEVEDEFTVCRVLRRIWKHRESLFHYQKAKNAASVRSRFFRLISTIESGGAVPERAPSNDLRVTKRRTNGLPQSGEISQQTNPSGCLRFTKKKEG
jgi:hypothetical protein